jgi:hypothetical protein
MSTYFKIVHKFENVRKTEICSRILKIKKKKHKRKKIKLKKQRRKTVKPERKRKVRSI